MCPLLCYIYHTVKIWERLLMFGFGMSLNWMRQRPESIGQARIPFKTCQGSALPAYLPMSFWLPSSGGLINGNELEISQRLIFGKHTYPELRVNGLQRYMNQCTTKWFICWCLKKIVGTFCATGKVKQRFLSDTDQQLSWSQCWGSGELFRHI